MLPGLIQESGLTVHSHLLQKVTEVYIKSFSLQRTNLENVKMFFNVTTESKDLGTTVGDLSHLQPARSALVGKIKHSPVLLTCALGQLCRQTIHNFSY